LKEVEEVAGSVLPSHPRQVGVRRVQLEVEAQTEVEAGDGQVAYQLEGHMVQEGEEDHPKAPGREEEDHSAQVLRVLEVGEVQLGAWTATSSWAEVAARLKGVGIQQRVGGSPFHPWEGEVRCHDQRHFQVGEEAYRH
jgi:hypothetical protein